MHCQQDFKSCTEFGMLVASLIEERRLFGRSFDRHGCREDVEFFHGVLQNRERSLPNADFTAGMCSGFQDSGRSPPSSVASQALA